MTEKKDDIAGAFRTIGHLLELKEDANPHRIRAYFDGADAVEDADIDDLIDDPRSIPNIGNSLAEKIEEYFKTGKIHKVSELKGDLDFDVGELTDIEGIGVKTAQKLYNTLGVQNVDDLEHACKNKRVRNVDGLGEKTEQNILEEIKAYRKGASERILREKVEPTVEEFLDRLGYYSVVNRAEAVGSYRRGKETVGDIDILVTTTTQCSHKGDAGEYLFRMVKKWKEVEKVFTMGDTKMSFRIEVENQPVEVDIRVVDDKEFGAGVLYFTGDKSNNVELRKVAIKQGMKLNEYGLFDKETGERVAGETEKGIYEALEVPYQEPSERDGDLPEAT